MWSMWITDILGDVCPLYKAPATQSPNLDRQVHPKRTVLQAMDNGHQHAGKSLKNPNPPLWINLP